MPAPQDPPASIDRRTFLKNVGASSLSTLALANSFAVLGAASAAAQPVDDAETDNIVFPPGLPTVIDVTQAPYFCDNAGREDCTAALIRVLDDVIRPNHDGQQRLVAEIAADPRSDFIHPLSVENRKENGQPRVIFPSHPAPARIVYFPNGTYRVSDTICYTYDDLQNSEGSELNRQIVLRGQSRHGVVIRLQDRCPGFAAGANKPVISFIRGRGSNVAMANYCEHLTIDTGAGNAGASGLRFFSNNTGAVRHVTVRSGDPAGIGATGIQCDRYNLSGCFFRDIAVEGFDYGVQVMPYRMYAVFEHVRLRGQHRGGFLVDETPVALRGLISENAVPGLTIAGQPAHVVLLDSELRGTGAGAPVGSAIELAHGVLFARSVRVAGYAATVGRFGDTIVPAGDIDEYSSHGVYTVTGDANARSLDLPVAETPEVPWERDFTQWVSVNACGAIGDGVTDDTAAIQAALNAGKRVVYFEPGRYVIDGQLTVPASVTRINFMFCDLVAGPTLRDMAEQGTFRIVAMSSTPLVIEDLFAFEDYRGQQYFIDHACRRTLVLSDLHIQTGAVYFNSVSGGKVFIENVCSTDQFEPNPNCYRFSGQEVWARQLNPERADPEVINDGGRLWVLGFKTEGRGTGFRTTAGGETEILGGVINAGSGDRPFLDNEGARTSISCAANAGRSTQQFNTLAREKSATGEKRQATDVLNKRILWRGDYYSFRKAYYAEQFFVPLYVGDSTEDTLGVLARERGSGP